MRRISFIIIGRNEGWKLDKCFKSIFDTINHQGLSNVEVIYVDSNSVDKSIEIAKTYESMQVFQLTKDCNAAIARNVGASNSTGDILFFIDGDMELQPLGFKELFDLNENLKYEFVSGDFENYYYESSESNEVISTEMYFKNKEISKNFTTGGLFGITRKNWESVGGMRNEFRRSQDMDLGLRLSGKGIFLHRLPVNLANHHTVNYRSKHRLWRELFDDTHYYVRSLLYRKNINNRNMYKLMLKQDYTLIFLLLSLFAAIIFQSFNFFIPYVALVILRAIVGKNLILVPYFIIRDIKVLHGLLLFHPKKNLVAFNLL